MSDDCSRLRLMYVITGLGRGGAETQVVLLAKAFAIKGWNVSVVSLLEASREVRDELEASGIAVAHLGMRRGVPDPTGILRLVRLMRSARPTIVHSHMVHANVLARIARLVSPVPVLISTAHNIIEGPRWREWLYRATDWLTDLTTQVSQVGLERYVRLRVCDRERALFIPNGVDTFRFKPDPVVRVETRRELGLQDEFAWLAVGRLEPAKDYPTLLRAFAHLRSASPQPLLLIAGHGALADTLRDMAARLEIAERVRFLGLRNDVPALMNAADAFVLSSAWEGMPMVLLEASASGLPIVATDVGGNREVVLNGETGLLVPSGDPRALANAMACVMAMTSDQRTHMGQRARERVRREYSIERVVQLWESVYVEALYSRRRGG